MEEMREAAMAYYAKLPNDQKQLVLTFFKTLDGNRDGKVSIQEYSDSVKEAGRSKFLTPKLFKLLDKDDDGTLDFEECVTFFYMDNSSRLALCDGCGSYMLGLCFICECYNDGERTYDLCRSCYHNNNFNHVHSSSLDNYALLGHLRNKKREDNTSAAVQVTQIKELEEGIRGFETVVRPARLSTMLLLPSLLLLMLFLMLLPIVLLCNDARSNGDSWNYVMFVSSVKSGEKQTTVMICKQRSLVEF